MAKFKLSIGCIFPVILNFGGTAIPAATRAYFMRQSPNPPIALPDSFHETRSTEGKSEE